MDDRKFRNAMGNFATGVTVITTEVNGDIHGMTANAFMSLSLDPNWWSSRLMQEQKYSTK